MPTPFDPQLDVNVLIGLIRNAPEMVAYAVRRLGFAPGDFDQLRGLRRGPRWTRS